MLQINLSQKTVVFITGKNQKKITKALYDSGLLADFINLPKEIRSAARKNPSSVYRPVSRISRNKLVNDKFVNPCLESSLLKYNRVFIKESVFDTLVISGALRTPGQVEFVARSAVCNFKSAQKIIVIFERAMFDNHELAESARKLVEIVPGSILCSVDASDLNFEIEDIINLYNLPVTIPQMPVVRLNPNLNPTMHLLSDCMNKKYA
jgi:hypothetical protein